MKRTWLLGVLGLMLGGAELLAQPPAKLPALPGLRLVAPPPRTKSADLPEELPPPRKQDEPPKGSVVMTSGTPLLLPDVLASADHHFPLLLAVLQEQNIAAGQLLAAQGAFDLNLRARDFWQLGTYDSQRINVYVDQNLPDHGISYYAGYRHSLGQFPIYSGDRKTGEGGELRAGILIPLLAGREIDLRRARMYQADIARRLADPIIYAQRIDVLRAAARAYWTWIGVNRRYQIARSILEIAMRRDKQLAELVKAGQVAEIERTDNQRVVIERQARLVVAERAVQQAAIALSLYLRDPAGNPAVPPYTCVPKELAEPMPVNPERVREDAALALTLRPELHRLKLQRERFGVEVDLAKNLMLPGVNFGIEGAQDFGFSSPFSSIKEVKRTQLDRTTYMASIQFDLPLQRRDARGRILAAEAAIGQLLQQERFAQDRIIAEIQDATSALQQTHLLFEKAREGLKVARKVEAAENERFLKGQSTLLILNLRELITAEASFAEVDALAEYHRSLADYRAAVGVDTGLPPAAQKGPVPTTPCPPPAPVERPVITLVR